MSSILDVLGGNSDLESEEEETMVNSKQNVDHEVKNGLLESPLSGSKERKVESDAEKEMAKVEHVKEADASNEPPEVSTTSLFRFISAAMDDLKRNGKNEKAKALDTAAPIILGLLKAVVQAASKKQDVDVGRLIFEAATKLGNDADNSGDYECFLRCADVVTQLLNDCVLCLRSPYDFKKTHGVPTREEMHKEAERLRRRRIELQLNLKLRENERKRRDCTAEVNDGFLTRSAEQLRNKEAAKKVWRPGKRSSMIQLQSKVLAQQNYMPPSPDYSERHCRASFSPLPSESVIQAELDRAVALRSANDKKVYRREVSDFVAIPAEELMDHGSDTCGQPTSNGASMTERSPLHETNMDLRFDCSSSSKTVLSGDISLPSVSSSHPQEALSSSVQLVEVELDLSLSQQGANTFELLTASSAQVVKKNDEADLQFARATSSRSQQGNCMELDTERTREVTSVSTVLPKASPEEYHPVPQPSQLNEERRAPASERYADIACVKIRKAKTATKQKRTLCRNEITADVCAVLKTAKRAKKCVKFHDKVVTSVRLYNRDISPQDDSSYEVVDIDGDTFRSYYKSGSMIRTNSSQPMQWNSSVFIRREPISEEIDKFYASCNIGCQEESVIKNWLVIDSSLDLLNEMPFTTPSKHGQFPSTIITRARFPPLLFEQFRAAMTAVCGKVGSMNVFLAVSRDVALNGQGSAQFFIDFLLEFAAHLMHLYKTRRVGQHRRPNDHVCDAVYNDPPFLEAPRVLVVTAPKDSDKKRERCLRTFNAELEAFVRHEAEMDDRLSAFYERKSRARLRFCLIDWRRICTEVGANTEASSVSALINHLMLDWAVIPPTTLR